MLNTSQIMLDFAKLCLALMLNAKRLKIMPKSIIMLNMATLSLHEQSKMTRVVYFWFNWIMADDFPHFVRSYLVSVGILKRPMGLILKTGCHLSVEQC